MKESAVKNSQLRATRSGRPLKSVKVNPQNLIPKYSDLANDLSKANLLPAIVFIFSRVGCEQAAQMVLQSKNHLLLPEESSYISQAITNFARNNPEIPISRNMVLMLKAGVAVHHAGLIPVWKSFIEDLFNGNKIKILFATETLAAGVNMPARTTVISTVTKRINSEIVKLKTSQLLQMV
jgi:superfamily II RNA helicase